MFRRFLYASLLLTPLALLARFAFHWGDTTLFVLAALALIPLAWLIGEATEHAGEHTGPGVAGFLNASFGNAPELIIALFLIPSIPGFHGDPDRHRLAWVTLPVAIVLILVYLVQTVRSLRAASRAHAESGHEADEGGWTLPLSLGVLGAATLATALISEIMVHSLESFAHSAGLSEFFIATVIVAIVGNAAEHGGAVVIAHRGKMKLATEIAVSSGAQVALFVAGGIALLSWAMTPLPLSFRPIELAAMGGAAALVALAAIDGKTRRWEGWVLILMYVGVAAGFFAVGDR